MNIKRMIAWLNARKFTSVVTIILLAAGLYLAYRCIAEFFFSHGYYRGTHHDFLAFYGAAKFTLDGHIAYVYDMARMTAFQRTVIDHAVGAQGYMPYLNPPAIAVLLSPLAAVSLYAARNIWFITNFVLMLGISYSLVRKIPNLFAKIILILLLTTTFPVYQNLLQGQLSILILGVSLMALRFGKKNRPILSGACLAVFLIKPQFGVMIGAGLLLTKQWKALFAMASTILAVIITFLPFTGLALYGTYIHFLGGVTNSHINGAGAITESVWQGRLSYTIGVNGLFTSIFGQQNILYTNLCTAITIINLLLLFGLALKFIKPGFKKHKNQLMLIAGICLMLLIDPHAYSQDALLVYAALPLLLSLRPRATTVLAFICFVQLNMIDQNKPIHLVTLSLLCIVIGIFIDIIKNHSKASRFEQLITS